MKALIIEDELIASQNLQRLLNRISPDIEVERTLESVEEAVEFFSGSNDIELVFMDIHLADGLAFHIFDSVRIQCPIIFTTAYDQYAIDAFRVNSIDYLLKPIKSEDLERALDKYRNLKSMNVAGGDAGNLTATQIASLMQMVQQPKYKSHMLIPLRDKLIPLPVSQIAYIYLDDKISRLVTFEGQQHALDKPLDAIFAQLDPSRFFRANRQYIIAHDAVSDISLWPLSKLHVSLSVPTPEKIIISRARVAEFKEWFTD